MGIDHRKGELKMITFFQYYFFFSSQRWKTNDQVKENEESGITDEEFTPIDNEDEDSDEDSDDNMNMEDRRIDEAKLMVRSNKIND